MKIIKEFNYLDLPLPPQKTKHGCIRLKRLNRLRKRFSKGKVVQSFLVDNENGKPPTVDVIRDNRIIEFYDSRSMRLITCIYARDSQLKRYFKTIPPCISKYVENQNH